MSALGDVAVGVVARGLFIEQAGCDNPGTAERLWRNIVKRNPETAWHPEAAAALASLDSPAVVQGVAEVLAPHVEAPRDRQTWPSDIYDAWNEAATRSYTEAFEVADGMWRLMVAQDLVAALGGRAS